MPRYDVFLVEWDKLQYSCMRSNVTSPFVWVEGNVHLNMFHFWSPRVLQGRMLLSLTMN